MAFRSIPFTHPTLGKIWSILANMYDLASRRDPCKLMWKESQKSLRSLRDREFTSEITFFFFKIMLPYFFSKQCYLISFSKQCYTV